MTKERIAYERLKQLISYDPATGIFVNLVNRGKTAKIGGIPGCLSPQGYWQITIDGQTYTAHQLAIFYMTKRWAEEVDHRDRDRLNNKYENLRFSNRILNAANAGAHFDSKSRVRGVHWNRYAKKWQASIWVNGIGKIYLGLFDDLVKAARAVSRTSIKFNGESADFLHAIEWVI
jgi:HNH endonuclease